MPESHQWHEILAAIHEQSTVGSQADLVPLALALGRDVARGVAGCSLTERDGAEYRTPAASNPLAFELDQAQYAVSDGPCIHAARESEVCYLADLNEETRFSGFTAAALRAGVRSSLSVPVRGRDHPTALNLYSTLESAFGTDHALATADLLSRTITAISARPAPTPGSGTETVEVIDARRNGNRVRVAVEQLRRHDGLTQAAAFNLLIRRSREQQVSLLTVAEEVLSG